MEFLERLGRAFEPIGLLENQVCVEPPDFRAGLGQLRDRNVQQPLLLPHDIRAPELEDIRAFIQFELIVPKGELNHADADILFGHAIHERVEILTFRFVSRRVEIGRDDAEIGSHLDLRLMRL